MNIEEFQAKEMLRDYGIAVPAGAVAASAEQARDLGAELAGERWMVKAQIPAGGRGAGEFAGAGPGEADGGGGKSRSGRFVGDGAKHHRGGIRSAASVDEIHAHAAAMLGGALITAQTDAAGQVVKRVYVEQAVRIERELAIALRIDEGRRRLVVMLFEHGGMGIEDAAATPQTVHTVSIDADGAADQAQLGISLTALDLTAALQDQLRDIIAHLIRLFRERDASSIEINPLAVVDGAVLALDAKMTFDNHALFRQPALRTMQEALDADSQLAALEGFNYIPLGGDIACLAVGAGLAMATLDAVHHGGGRAANFLNVPPDAKVNRILSALQALLARRGARSLLINVFGGGIMRCDAIADAILLARRRQPLKIPATVRLAGTNAALANRRLKESAPEIFLAANLADAAAHAVAASKGGSAARAPASAGSRATKWLGMLGLGRRAV